MRLSKSVAAFAFMQMIASFTHLNAATSVIGPVGEGNGEVGEAINGYNSFTGNAIQFYLPSSMLSAVAGQSLTGLAFRLDSEYGPSLPTYGYENLTLTIASSTAGSLLSSNFATNSVGATTVFDGAFFYEAGSFGTGGSPNDFGSFIKFSTPYLYEDGDLVLTLRHSVPIDEFGNPFDNGGDYFSADADSTGAPEVLVASDQNSTNGMYWSYVPVIAITTEDIPDNYTPIAVPEPSGAILLLTGAIGFLGMRRRPVRSVA